MTWVALGIGSNVDARDNLTSCLDMLLLIFQDMALSSVFESEAVGYEGDNYLNMVVSFDTDLKLPEIIDIIKEVERKHGRSPKQDRYARTSLDIDLLTYGQKQGNSHGINLPRGEITSNAFVLWPLSQVAARHKHPLEKKTYQQLWAEYPKDSQKLWPVDFSWHGRTISLAERNKP